MGYTHTMEYYSAVKGMTFWYKQWHREPWNHYANKSETKRQILHDSRYIKYLKWANSYRQNVDE